MTSSSNSEFSTSEMYAGEVTVITSSHKHDPELPEDLQVAMDMINLY